MWKETMLTGLFVTLLARDIDTSFQPVFFCEYKEPDQPPDEAPDSL
jgi:hypothetical protein